MAVPNAGRVPIEPDAAHWKTWVLESSDSLRPDVPPNAEATTAELTELKQMIASADAQAQAAVRYWDAGTPNYR